MHTYLYGSPLGHSKLNYWFASSNGGDYGPGGRCKYVSRDYYEYDYLSDYIIVTSSKLQYQQ